MGANKNDFTNERLRSGEDIPHELEELFKATDEQVERIDSLLWSCSLDDVRKKEIEDNLFTYSGEEAEEVIKMLLNNQSDPFKDGGNYTQTDILNRLRKFK